MQSVLAYHLIEVGRRTGVALLTQIGRAILDAYAQYGYNPQKGTYYAELKLDGTPVSPMPGTTR